MTTNNVKLAVPEVEMDIDERLALIMKTQEEMVGMLKVIRVHSKPPKMPIIHRIRHFMKWYLGIRVGFLIHHDPVHLSIPKRYLTPIPLANPPRITIVTPSFRQGEFIERTISSVLSQDYPNLEYVVQDGGSTDDTCEVLQTYTNRLARWESKRDKGQSDAINLGFQNTTGEIMAYLNSDDILLPGSLAYVAKYFQDHPDVDVVYGHRVLIDEEDSEIGRWVMPPHDNEVLSWTDYIPQETLFWRRSIWEKAGNRIDDSFQFAMDWDLLLRLRDAGAKMVRLPRFLGCFRVHAVQKTSAQIKDTGIKEMAKLRYRCHGRYLPPREIRNNTLPYLYRQGRYHWMYQLGLLRH